MPSTSSHATMHDIPKPKPVETDEPSPDGIESSFSWQKYDADKDKSHESPEGSEAGDGAAARRTPARGSKRALPPAAAAGSAAVADLRTPTPRRVSARRSLKHSPLADESAPPLPPTPTLQQPTPAPKVSTKRKAEAAGSSNDDADMVPPTPDRKIWMRPCNECGVELHVRRTRCTECGSPQTSKRSIAQTRDEQLRAEVLEQQEEVSREEASEAAGALAAIMASPKKAMPAMAADAPRGSRRASKEGLAASKAFLAGVAKLTPEQLIKLRRLMKLKALLNNLPEGVTLPKAAFASTASAPSAAAAAPSAADAAGADAIAMLASVACM